MLQESRLSCSCQEATVTLPPGLGELFVDEVPGEQASSSNALLKAAASTLRERRPPGMAL